MWQFTELKCSSSTFWSNLMIIFKAVARDYSITSSETVATIQICWNVRTFQCLRKKHETDLSFRGIIKIIFFAFPISLRSYSFREIYKNSEKYLFFWLELFSSSLAIKIYQLLSKEISSYRTLFFFCKLRLISHFTPWKISSALIILLIVDNGYFQSIFHWNYLFDFIFRESLLSKNDL